MWSVNYKRIWIYSQQEYKIITIDIIRKEPISNKEEIGS